MAKTPFMKQYCELKEKYKEYILFFRMGDFYEMFYSDAELVSRELELVLTGRDCGEEERAPMCGIPYHSAEGYIGKLVARGYKVAVCEQLEDPAKAKGLVKRDVIRIITPGTVIESSMLEETTNNYICSICIDGVSAGLSFFDISTGEAFATATDGGSNAQMMLNELAKFKPKEILLNMPASEIPMLDDFIKTRLQAVVNDKDAFRYDIDKAQELVRRQFPGERSRIEADGKALVRSVGAMLFYLSETQKTDISYIHSINVYGEGQFMEMDVNTRRNLELCETMRLRGKRGSLLGVLDKTKTAMGARLLRKWIEMPLVKVKPILRRQKAVGEMTERFIEREEIAANLREVLDLERLLTKIVYNTVNPRDLRSICTSLAVIPAIKENLSRFECEELKQLNAEIEDLTDIVTLIDSSVVDENTPFSVREGGIFKDAVNRDVDELRDIVTGGKDWIKNVEAEEREATGIKTLKIRYNKVFGYYIEVSNSYTGSVPETYIRKQTLTNGERYITKELKDKEAMILGARDKVNMLEYELFQQLRNRLNDQIDRMQTAAHVLARLDVYQSLADVASRNQYCCPEVDDSDVIQIKDGRHPVVEAFSADNYFVPNDTELDTGHNRLLMITGPNMAGKSTYMRQTALICLLAQMGSFVPAREARIGIVDKLFTRVGASDDLASGQSTFMLEMTELAYIVAHATKRSLIIYDEIGRGTSTFDGMSIARAVAEYTSSKKLGARTLFATHYHELTSLETEMEGIVNYHIAAKKKGEDIIFLRKIVRGGADDSYGIEVARLAGVPNEIIKRAREVLAGLEESGNTERTELKKTADDEKAVPSLVDYAVEEIKQKLLQTDINTLTPIEAMSMLYEMKRAVGG